MDSGGNVSFLEESDVAKLTGIKKGRGGKTRAQLQIEQLREMGIAFRVNARGLPIISWSAIDGQKVQQNPAKSGWAPAVLSAAG